MNGLQKRFWDSSQDALIQPLFNAIGEKAIQHVDAYIQIATEATLRWEAAAGKKSTTRKPILEEKVQKQLKATILGQFDPAGQDADLVISMADSFFNIASVELMAEFLEILEQF